MTDRYVPPHMRNRPLSSAGSGTVFTSLSRSGRCAICNDPHNHICPLRKQSLQKVALTSTLPDYDCFADWHVKPSPDDKVHVWIHVKLNGPEVSYVLIGDYKERYVGCTKFRPPKCKKYIEIPVSDLALSGEENESRLAADRILKSNVYGNSLRTRPTDVDKTKQFLLIEERLIEKLQLSSGLYNDGRVDVRISKGLIDYHDMDTACAVFLGDNIILDSIAQDMGVDVPRTDLICTETKGLLDCNDIREVREVMTCIQERGTGDGKSTHLNHHLKFALDEMRRVREGFPSHMLLTVVDYDDMIDIAIPGTSRRLGETPLECALRTANEKAGIDISSNLRIKDSPEVYGGCHTDGSVMWELFLHSQEGVNQYYFRAVTSPTTATLGEDAAHVVASDLSESFNGVSISS